MHPTEVLFQGMQYPVSLPVCDHYAGSDKLMRKSMALQQELGPVFDITFDCEDGAAAGSEQDHAQRVAELINSQDNHFDRIGVRVHDVASPFFDQDVALTCQSAAARIAYVVLPKVDGVAQTRVAIDRINRLTPGRKLPIHVLVETHGALHDAHAIAALEQVECLSFGIMDFVSAHYGAIPADAMHSPGQFMHPLVTRAKLEIAAACHAHGKVPSHNVTTDIRDSSVVALDAQRAATQFGYTRMWSIHPDQIQPILQAFAPRTAELDEAAGLLAEAQAQQWAPIRRNGRLHDRASYRYYWTVLQRARASGLALAQSASALL